MVKTIALLSRKEGISREEFARHYEETHAPLALRLLPMIKGYARNHISEVPFPAEPSFDCVSEFRFDSLEDAMKVMEVVQSEEGRPLREDEAQFIDGSRTVSFLVDEVESDLPESGEAAKPGVLKAIALLKRKEGTSRQEFIDHYEQVHAPLIIRNSVGLVRYVRNYVIVGEGGPEPEFDAITGLWYRDRKAFEASMALRNTEAGSAIEKDERSFLDLNTVMFVFVDERISK